MKSGPSITADERTALSAVWNLADAHPRQALNGREKGLVESLPSLFASAHDSDYFELELASAAAFASALGQQLPRSRPIALYSSSIAMMVVARFARSIQASVQLTCPTFDNIHALLIAEGVTVVPRSADSEGAVLLNPQSRIVLEVSPNNPTGSVISKVELIDLAKRCKESGRILVLDQSFKGQVEQATAFDHYEVLSDAGVSYVVIEDTGKLWPTLDLKVAFLLCSNDLLMQLEDIVDDVLLNVSPFLLEVVRRFSELSTSDSWESVRSIVATNRSLLRELVAASGLPLSVSYPSSLVSVEVLSLWPSISRDWRDHLEGRGVAVLDAAKFFWDPSFREESNPMMRVSLARDPQYFEAAARALLDGLWIEWRAR
jgi:aspartate/methionine/tyrosine aminotransferase